MTIPRPSRHCDQGTSNSSIFWHFIVLVSITSLHILNDDLIDLCALRHLSFVTGGVRRSALLYCLTSACGFFCSASCLHGVPRLSPTLIPYHSSLFAFVCVTGVGLLSYHFSSLFQFFFKIGISPFFTPLDFVFFTWVSFSPLRSTRWFRRLQWLFF